MQFDIQKNNQQVSVENGSILGTIGDPCKSIIILHQGSLRYEIKTKNGDLLKVFEISGKNLTPGIISILNRKNLLYNLVTTSDSIISTYSVNPDTIFKVLQAKQNLGIMVTKTLLLEIKEFSKLNQKINDYNAELQSYIDNISIFYYALRPDIFPDLSGKESGFEYNPSDLAINYCHSKVKTFINNAGILPTMENFEFLDEKHPIEFQSIYSTNKTFDSEFLTLEKLMNSNVQVLLNLFSGDPSMLTNACEKFSDTLQNVYFDSVKGLNQAYTFTSLFMGGDNNFIEKYHILMRLIESGYTNLQLKPLYPVFLNLLNKINFFKQSFSNLFNKEFPQIGESVQNFTLKIVDLTNETQSNSSNHYEINDSENALEIRKALNNSVNKIIEFSQIPKERIDEIKSYLLKFKEQKKPLDSEPDVRKIRRHITRVYWEIYQNSIKKYMFQKDIPKEVELFLNYGYFDETLVTDEQICFLYNHDLTKDQSEKNIPISTGVEWLEKIYRKETPTSLDELGQSFFDKVRIEHKLMQFKKENELPSEFDHPEARLNYEVNSMYEVNAKLTSGSVANYFPILTMFHTTRPLKSSLVTKKKLSQAILEILNVDYTAFTREIVYNNDENGIRREFIQTSIIPDFILMPSIGTRSMMWQELSVHRGFGSKTSKGRITLPMFISFGELKTVLLDAIAAFRWELCKTIHGVDWNNVSISSITADYTDYVQFFKKNKDLSIEVKEKLAAEFKRFRNDRDIFAKDYKLWIQYESQGILRLNRVVRNIFYRHIPFAKPIRDKLALTPGFSEIHNKFINIRAKKLTELGNRYKKYMIENKLPDVLEKNMDFYRV